MAFPKTYRALISLLVIASAKFALAGTPFITDDPGFAPSGWEIDLAGVYAFNNTGQSLALPALTLNYSFTEHFEVIAAAGLSATFPDEGSDEAGLTDTALGVKWRFLDEKPDRWWPAISISPNVNFPTASQSRGLGDERWRAQLPIEIGKTFGKTYVYGEFGFQHVFPSDGSTADEKLLFGTAVQYQLTKAIMIGGEIYGTYNLNDFTDQSLVADVAGSYAFTDTFQIQATIGRTLEDDSRGGPKLFTQIVFVWYIP
jgi:hypothetical protein